ncbi:MAG: glycosyltransferase family 2 protein [Coriobacteriia bacterium]|nr:glycosyltransferase family 2 protein [Coriobacteriia bacterium]
MSDPIAHAGVDPIQLSVVVVAYHSDRVIGDCLASVSKALPDAQVIVVDNGSEKSEDQLLTIARSASVTTISGQGNIGFGAACNLGARHATNESLLFLNPDARVDSCGRADLEETLRCEPLGIVAPVFVGVDGGRHCVVRPFSRLLPELAKHTVGNVTPRWFRPRQRSVQSGQEGWVSGAALIVQKSEFLSAGGFDERYFLYYEDQDLSRRYLLRGFPVRPTAALAIIHDSSTSSSATDASAIALSAAWLSWVQYVALWRSERTASKVARVGASLQLGILELVGLVAGVSRSARMGRKLALLAAEREFVGRSIEATEGAVLPAILYPEARRALGADRSHERRSWADQAALSAARLARPGYDPFDAMRSPWLRAAAGKNARARQLCVQLRKRGLLPLSAPLGIKPFRMAKTLGCRLSAIARLRCANIVDNTGVRAAADDLLSDRALARDPSGGWGYEFDVQTRWAFYPQGSANIIATLFVTRGLAEAGLATEDESLLDEATKGARYMLENLRVSNTTGDYFQYAPGSSALIHNANLLAAGVVASVGRITGRDEWVAEALHCASVSLEAVRADGLWAYGQVDGLEWVDNFHTAYPLDGVMLLWLATGDEKLRTIVQRGVRTWSAEFFGADGTPYYHREHHRPYDIHSAATAVDVAARMTAVGIDTGGLAGRVALWSETNLCDHVTGETRYQTGVLIGGKRHFLRWGEAHWALGLSSLVLAEAGVLPPLEAHLMRNASSS